MPLIRSPELTGAAPELTGAVPADTRPLLAATVVVLGLASMTVAAHLHTRWAGLRRLPMLGLHLGVCGLAVLGAAALLGTGVLRPVRDVGWAGLAAGLLLGPLVGYAATRADRSVTRWWGRRAGHSVRDDRPVALRSGHARPAGVAVAGAATAGRRTGLIEARNDFAPTSADLRVRLPLLLAVALAEELVYRGVLLGLALRAGPVLVVVGAVLGVQLVFAVSHVFFGWGQVLSKLPLAALCTGAVLLTGTVLPAVIGHALFNTWVWRYHRARPSAARQNRPAASAWGTAR
ncbi:CPBP family intramembrane glutamic endopeptidase [Streptomyces kanamyceticus]|uniref:CPBP family intramembrane metalloprotease n=1 Tax=Streptomyces kanamyceticus TaxID=1967 RepID=A0A5J6GLK8_STRKN|nr:CPBP family intramembrane glutamic endopeptidase [Streptomyces kanamyceticus]QEU93916.1 CPBP family intramembrane metalloprotease [Streptomyces kanamyceticus]